MPDAAVLGVKHVDVLGAIMPLWVNNIEGVLG
jgi:hypothetical protein